MCRLTDTDPVQRPAGSSHISAVDQRSHLAVVLAAAVCVVLFT